MQVDREMSSTTSVCLHRVLFHVSTMKSIVFYNWLSYNWQRACHGSIFFFKALWTRMVSPRAEIISKIHMVARIDENFCNVGPGRQLAAGTAFRI